MVKIARIIVTDTFVSHVNMLRASFPDKLRTVSLIDTHRKSGAALFPSAEGPWVEFPGGTITIIEDEAGEQLTAEILHDGKPITRAALEKLVAA